MVSYEEVKGGVLSLKHNILRWHYFLDVKNDFSHGNDPLLSSFEGDRDMPLNNRAFQIQFKAWPGSSVG